MRAHTENRTGRDRRQAVPRRSPNDVERRSGSNQRSQTVDEAAIYGTDKPAPQDYWESLSNIPSEDFE